jgi:hypothetical protein
VRTNSICRTAGPSAPVGMTRLLLPVRFVFSTSQQNCHPDRSGGICCSTNTVDSALMPVFFGSQAISLDPLPIPGERGIESAASLSKPRRLCHEVVLFGKTCCPGRGGSIVVDSLLKVIQHLKQMGAHSIETIVMAEAFIAVQSP